MDEWDFLSGDKFLFVSFRPQGLKYSLVQNGCIKNFLGDKESEDGFSEVHWNGR